MTEETLKTDAALPFALTRPAHVGGAHLVVSDLDRVSDYYQKVIGLSVIEKSPSGQVLGVAGVPLLTLSTGGSVSRAPRNAAGLFHTAFLVPNRAELARWLKHVAENNVPLEGASDHLVSEAIYLSDPEGNGIEVYRDRGPMEWTYHADGTVEMATDRLNLQELYNSAPKDGFGGMADGTALGHIHLQVAILPRPTPSTVTFSVSRSWRAIRAQLLCHRPVSPPYRRQYLEQPRCAGARGQYERAFRLFCPLQRQGRPRHGACCTGRAGDRADEDRRRLGAQGSVGHRA